MLIRNSDFGVDKRIVGGVLAHWIEDNFLVLEIMVSFVRKWWRSFVVGLIMRKPVAGRDAHG